MIHRAMRRPLLGTALALLPAAALHAQQVPAEGEPTDTFRLVEALTARPRPGRGTGTSGRRKRRTRAGPRGLAALTHRRGIAQPL